MMIMKNLRPTVLLIFSCMISVASAQHDTTEVRRLHQKAYTFLNTFPDSLLYYRDIANRLAVQLNDEVGIAESYTNLGVYHWVRGEYTAAIHAYDTSNQILAGTRRVDKQLKNYSSLGMAYSRLGDIPKAIRFLLEALRMAETTGDKASQATIYNSLGVAYKNQGSNDDAFLAYKKAIDLFQEVKKPENVGGAYSNIGNIFMRRGDYGSALVYQKKALSIFDSLQNDRGIVTCYNNLSEISLKSKNYGEAMNFSEKALEISEKKGFFVSQIAALLGLGAVSTELNDYARGEQYLLRAIRLAVDKNYRTELINIYRQLSDCYRGMGKKDDALKYFQLHAAMKDSLINQQSLATVSNLRTSYDLEKKEAAIEILRKDNEIAKLSRNRAILAAIGLLSIAASLVAWQTVRIRKDKQIHLQQKKLQDVEQALITAQLATAKVKEEELLKELEYKNRSLTTYALSMVQKNEILEEVKEGVDGLLKNPDTAAEHLKKLKRVVEHAISVDKDWEDFKMYFDEVHADFFSRLNERFPDLSSTDLRLCALIRLNLNMKQVASILRISPDSVKISRYRLRKKFNLQTEDNLAGFIMSI
jgi:tetratricopeptide (TPR) repeat protein